MAVTVERMVATLEARMDKFDKAMIKARGNATTAFTAITTEGDKMEARLSSLGSSGTKSIDQMTRSTRGLQAQTGNLAAQFNDIGVQLAGGQSPFLIAVQQGSQIQQVLGNAGVLGTARMLGGAFASLISPVSLLTFAVIGLGGAAIQYFASMLSSSDQSAEKLKEQAQLIQQVADKGGDALPALQAYSAELQKAADIAKAREATDVFVANEYAPAREALSALNVEMSAFLATLQDVGRTEGVLDIALDGLFAPQKAGGTGGGLLGVLSAAFGGARAAGGPVSAGSAYLVGEKGPEIIVPSRAGTVVPNHMLGRGASGGGSTSRTYHIDARGAQAGVGQEIAAALAAYDKQLDRNIGRKIAGARGMNRPGF